ncbi:MAG: MBL fold metallo-hydrolase [bacterium]|nr:MBL fold metallo-hydrolase [bacterium]
MSYTKRTANSGFFIIRLRYMTIQWYGQACFKLSGHVEDVTLVIDPFDPSLGWKLPKFQADIVAISTDTPEHNYLEAVKIVDPRNPFVLEGRGEYEVKGVFIYGVGVEKTTVYSFSFDELYVLHCGSLNRLLTEKEIDQIGKVDILLLPVGGGSGMSPRTAVEFIGQIEPRIVIPMCHKVPGLKSDFLPVEQFLKEYGIKDTERVDKFKISKKELPAEETQIILLNPM